MRADLYIYKGSQSIEYIGSLGFAGTPAEFPKSLRNVKTEDLWRISARSILSSRKDGTLEIEGWPWPWSNSRFTDYTYIFGDLENSGKKELFFCRNGSRPMNFLLYLEKENMINEFEVKYKNFDYWPDNFLEEVSEWEDMKDRILNSDKIKFPDMGGNRNLPSIKSPKNGFAYAKVS